MVERKFYALISILSLVVFAAIFLIHYYAYVGTGTIEGIKMELSVYRYLVEVHANDSCTFYLPVPSKDSKVMELNPALMSAPENWSWSIVNTRYGKMLELNVTGSGTFEAHLYPDEPVNTKHPEYLLEPRYNLSTSRYTTNVYGNCSANVHVEIVGENHWYEYRKFYLWSKKAVRCECYKDWVDASIERAGWLEVEGRLETEKECHGECLMCVWCQ